VHWTERYSEALFCFGRHHPKTIADEGLECDGADDLVRLAGSERAKVVGRFRRNVGRGLFIYDTAKRPAGPGRTVFRRPTNRGCAGGRNLPLVIQQAAVLMRIMAAYP